MSYPKQIQEIFEHLSRGQFLCENSPKRAERRLYELCESDYEAYVEYFDQLGFGLERGERYFYFSKKMATKTIEEKLARMMEYIDLVELMLQFSQTFGVGFRVSVAELEMAAKSNITLKNSIEKLKSSSKSMTLNQQCAKVLESFAKGGFMALEHEHEQRYTVLSSFTYLQTFLFAIEVPSIDLT